MNITDMPEKGKKERDLIAASLSPFAALPKFGKKLN